jgi:hypothetical protein
VSMTAVITGRRFHSNRLSFHKLSCPLDDFLGGIGPTMAHQFRELAGPTGTSFVKDFFRA